MQCHEGNREKRIAKCGVKLLQLKLGKKASEEEVHRYLVSNGEAIEEVANIICETSSNIQNKYQRNRVKEYGELGLWILLNHPKTRPAIINAINKITRYTINKDDISKVKLTLIEQKLLMKALKYTASKMMQGRYKDMRIDLLSSSNAIIKYLFEESNVAVQSIVGLSDDDKAAITIMIDCALWTMSRDTAYRDAFWWGLSKICSLHITNLINKHPMTLVKDPYKWYPNVWYRSKKRTQELKKKGELAPGQFCEAEKHCVPNIQNKILNKGR